MDDCLRSVVFRLWAEGPFGFRCRHVSVLGFQLLLQVFGLESYGFSDSVVGSVGLGQGRGNFEFRVWAAGCFVFRVRVEELQA